MCMLVTGLFFVSKLIVLQEAGLFVSACVNTRLYPGLWRGVISFKSGLSLADDHMYRKALIFRGL